MHKVADWTSLHSTIPTEVQDILQAWSANALLSTPPHWLLRSNPAELELNQVYFLSGTVIPALESALDINNALHRVNVHNLSESDEKRPHALFSEQDQSASIYLDWTGTASDAICLAHEMGHAAHYIMSDTDTMPPILRETCAFLGELIVLDALFENEDPLFDALHAAWLSDNEMYLGSDAEDLHSALSQPNTLYNYRWNYPVARLAAVDIFQSYKAGKINLADFFKSGAEGMRFLPMAQMASKADAIQNYLPPLHIESTPATAAYQSLGAMAFLDIDTYEGQSERSIGDVYADLLKSLQNQTAFIALREDKRPIGYATWTSQSNSNEPTLTHQAAPFGDHLRLLKTLQQRFATDGPVSAMSQRSARQEQLAW